MELTRKPTNEEKRLIRFLISLSKTPVDNDINAINIKPLSDGGMGSFEIIPKQLNNHKRTVGEMISEYEFKDKDGVKVLASLYLDLESNLYELDLWKTDFSPIIEIPSENLR